MPDAQYGFSRDTERSVMEKIFVTRSGHEKMIKDIEFLMVTRRREIAESLAHARSLGDLSENSEYESAKQAFDFNETRIRELQAQLHGVEIVSDADIPAGKVYLGATVRVRDLDGGEEETYKMVSSSEADPAAGMISVESPVAKAMLGHVEGDEVEIAVPRGTLRYRILRITRE